MLACWELRLPSGSDVILRKMLNGLVECELQQIPVTHYRLEVLLTIKM